MKALGSILAIVAGASCGIAGDDEISTIRAYVDTDVCSRLMIGPITPDRTNCSKSTFKDGSDAVLLRLSNNMVFGVNKPKMLKDFVGQLATATGELKVKDGQMKLQSVQPLDSSAIPANAPERKLLDVRTHKAATPGLYEKIRHELAMMPYITEFDFISFALGDRDVILTGWTVRITNRSEAENRVRNLEGVESVINNIEVLPLGRMDMTIRASARAALQRYLARYFWGSGSDIKIVVKNGAIILLGSVANKADSDMAYIQCNQVPNAFRVINMLRVRPAGS